HWSQRQPGGAHRADYTDGPSLCQSDICRTRSGGRRKGVSLRLRGANFDGKKVRNLSDLRRPASHDGDPAKLTYDIASAPIHPSGGSYFFKRERFSHPRLRPALHAFSKRSAARFRSLGTPSPRKYIKPRSRHPPVPPASQARLKRPAARFRSLGTPSPRKYIKPRSWHPLRSPPLQAFW